MPGAADHLARSGSAPAVASLALLAAFASGAAVSALPIDAGRRRGPAGIHAFSTLAEAVLLAAPAFAEPRQPGLHRGLPGVLGPSFPMGLRSTVVTRIPDARVRTTHVTDIGIEPGNLLDAARRGDPAPDAARPSREERRLHGQAVPAAWSTCGATGCSPASRRCC